MYACPDKTSEAILTRFDANRARLKEDYIMNLLDCMVMERIMENSNF